jgi:hypothetical protein
MEDDRQERRLTAAQRSTLVAIANRLVPTDEHGPGAVDSGAVRYVELSLAGAYAELLPAYVAGLDGLAAGGFADLTSDEQDAVLSELELGPDPAFFEMVRAHVMEGMFGDPAYGGNRDRAGWELLGYAGPKLVWTEAEQRIR